MQSSRWSSITHEAAGLRGPYLAQAGYQGLKQLQWEENAYRRKQGSPATPLGSFADDLGVSKARLGKALQTVRSTSEPDRALAVHYQPSEAKMLRVMHAAAELSLQEIDVMIDQETKGMKLLSQGPPPRARRHSRRR